MFHQEFIAATMAHPFLMGFAKVACLATYGECLKMRLAKGEWSIEAPVMRFIVWGLFGIWFAFAFPYASAGVTALIEKRLWLNGSKIWLAFSKSLWINILGGYAFSMMLVHQYLNACIDVRRLISLTEFAETMSGRKAATTWYRYIPLTILFFWLPAHTVTFLLPPVYYVLMAAVLSLALGFFLTVMQRK
jgi:hypothetical protein